MNPGWRWCGVLVLAVLAFAAGPAHARGWAVDAAHSSLGFTGSYQGQSFEGVFKRFDARIAYDPADLAHAKFDVSVDITSVDTQNSERDQAALGEAFFDTARFPRARFATTGFRKTADGKVLADGTLTLRGIRKPVTLEVTFIPHGDAATLDVTAHLKRLDFGIGSGEWADPSMIGNAVTVQGHLALSARD